MKKAFVIIFLLTLGFATSLVYAADDIGEELELYAGEVNIISVSTPKRIVIGNPEVVDVSNVTKSEITLNPKAAGTTTFIYWDDFGEHSYKVKVFSEGTNELKARVDKILNNLGFPGVHAEISAEEGKALIVGTVKSPQERERIIAALETIKDRIIDLIKIKEEETMVDIDVQVVELSRDATKSLGFTMPASVSAGETPGRFSRALRASLDPIAHVFDWPRSTNFTVTFDALVQEGKARILSRPRLACQSGKEAELLVGGEKPILTTEVVSGGGSGTEVSYKEYGIKLKIKPEVNEENRIKLALKIEVSEVESAPVTLGNPDQPTAKAWPLTKRTASTELFLYDGQTIAIGGLIKQKSEENVRKTAGLGDIPILGMLFRRKETKLGGGAGERGDTELFITLTPSIISQKKPRVAGEIKPAVTSAPIPSGLPEAVAAYTQVIQKRIMENLVYPELAKGAGFQGTVKLGLHFSYSGKLLGAMVKESSGYKILDDEAVNVAKGISSYPPFPSSVKQKEIWIDVPIVYQLD